jgi:hypothetical protein
MRKTLRTLISWLVLLAAFSVQGSGSERMGGGEGKKTKSTLSTPKMGGMSSGMKSKDSNMKGMALTGMTPRGKPGSMGGMSKGMTERRAIGMSRMSQGVPGISNEKKASKRRRSAGMKMLDLRLRP